MNKAKITTFTITLFISACLMFALQPMIGKMLLPIVGGSPAGWIVALSFFQIMLLGGYFIAHALSKLSPIKQSIVYICLLMIGALFLPISIKNIDISDTYSPAISVLRILTLTVAVPFISISATNSTIQRLFTISQHSSAKDPYFLYAASNTGSFIGLLLYPFAIEPLFTVNEQSFNWSMGYAVLIAFVILCLILTISQKRHEEKRISQDHASWKLRLEWIALSFIPSALLSAVTTHITTDIFSAPLIWIIPLGIYLLTFVIAFSNKKIISYDFIKNIYSITVGATFFLATLASRNISLSIYAMIIHIFTFTIIALMAHMKLASKRPDSKLLTEFYLAMSIGGALGGAINAFIFPFIFNGLYEYPLLLISSYLIHDSLKEKIPTRNIYMLIIGVSFILLGTCFYQYLVTYNTILTLIMLCGFILTTAHPKSALIVTTTIFTITLLALSLKPQIFTSRNFYGVIKVYNNKLELDNNESAEIKYMQHGTTIHGYQFTDSERELLPTSYYFKGGPIDTIINTLNPKNIVTIGMGTGTINCYINKDRHLTFIEIDKNVVTAAKDYFSYLSKCGNGMPDIIIGDGRLKIAEYTKEKLDMIIIDAFSSDTVPTHLLTKEAIETYLSKLTENGVIVFHISNRYFDLASNISTTANELNLKNAYIATPKKDVPKYGIATKWIVLTKKGQTLSTLYNKGFIEYETSNKEKVWTDNYTNILSTLLILK